MITLAKWVDGDWYVLGDFETLETAKKAARENGRGKYGYAVDPDDYWYEGRFSVT